MLTGNQILQASFDEIVFQNRNKAYGAFLLRREYEGHMKWSVGIMLALCLCAFGFYFWTPKRIISENGQVLVNTDLSLVHPPPPPQIPLPPPPAPEFRQAIRTEIFTQPLIVKESISPEDMPPEVDVLEGAKIGLQKTEGVDIDNLVSPPVEAKSLAEVMPSKNIEETDTKIWTSVEIVAEFPGGQGEWMRYLQKNLRYPENAIDNGTQGVVRVQFVIDREGNISEVHALNDLGYGLAEEAIRIIKKGPKWKPAEQNGRKVIYRHIQAITFRLE
jgi:protein TonB